MAKIPTIKLLNTKTGIRQTINVTEYQRDISGYITRDWKIISEQRGDATDAQILNSQRESDIERHRQNDDARERKFGDRQRVANANRLTVTTKTDDEVATPSTAHVEEGESPPPVSKPDEGWGKMKWHARRQYVKDFTGSANFPQNAAGAKKMMDEFLK